MRCAPGRTGLALLLGFALPSGAAASLGCRDRAVDVVDAQSNAEVSRATTPTTPTADPTADTVMAGGRLKALLDDAAVGPGDAGNVAVDPQP